MNLAFEPWIPVTGQNGQARQASLADIFLHGQDYADLAVRPHERIALMRLLICVASAALDGPANVADLANVAPELPAATQAYLEKWLDRFDLFHPEQPFLQRADIMLGGKKAASADEDAIAVSKLDFSLATGNNSTLFDHGGGATGVRSFTPAWLALQLLTFQAFSPGGLIGMLVWRGQETARNSRHAPCTPSSMLHTFIRRANVLDTVLANLLGKRQIKNHYGAGKWGKPIWEWPPSGPQDEAAIDNATQTWLGRLVPMARLIRIFPDGRGMLLGNGLAYPVAPEFPSEPSATEILKKDKSGKILLRGDLDKAIWRELPALASARERKDGRGPLALTNLPEDAACDLWVGALVADKASILDTVEAVFHCPQGIRLDRGMQCYQEGVEVAEKLAGRLGWAVETFREHIDGGWTGRLKLAGPKKWEIIERLRSQATRHYWTAVEQRRDQLMACTVAVANGQAEAPELQKQWPQTLHALARDAYRVACAPQNAREQRAFALGWGKLFATKASEPGAPAPSEAPDQTNEAELNQ